MAGLKLIPKVNAIAGVLFLLCLVPGWAAAAEEGPKDWRFSKPIETAGGGKYHSFLLDEEVYAGADETLSDLRILDGKGKFVPFYIDSGYAESSEEITAYSSALVNTMQKDYDTSFDFRIDPKKEHADILGNTLAVEVPKESFLKHVEVYGSFDGNNWQALKKDDLFRKDRLEKNSIELGSELKYSYYRLTVLNNVENLRFPKLQLIHNTRSLQWNNDKKTGTPAYDIQQEDKLTKITVRNEHRLKIKKVILSMGGTNFTRPYAVYDPNGKLLPVDGSKELYVLDFKDVQIANTAVVLSAPAAKPEFTIKITNDDSPPLDITGITAEYFVDKVVFEDRGDGPYQLLYGNGRAGKPRYDIENFRTHIGKENVALGKLGEQTAASESLDTPSRPWWFQTKVWFNAVIIAVSLLLILFLAIKLKPGK